MFGLKRILGTEEGMIPPHGALCGYDPYNFNTGNDYKFLQTQAVPDGGAFLNAFGQEKLARFGEDKCGQNPYLNFSDETSNYSVSGETVSKLRSTIRDYFTQHYYKLSDTKSRVIFLVFGSAVPIVIDRLMESNSFDKLIESDCYLIALPYDVSVFKNATPEILDQVYRFYASLFYPLYD